MKQKIKKRDFLIIKMRLSALSSGSSGNCFYVESNENAILIDAGISAKQIVERLSLINRNPEKIKGIFVTHEHSDHIKGIDVFARQFQIPIFANKKTAESCFLCSDDSLIQKIKNTEIIKISNLEIQSFSKFHKASDPISFSITNDKKISIITDAGFACKNIIENISDSDFLCLESNHDVKMLESGPYPFFLKQWIKSNIGHLSNTQAGLLVLEHASPKLKKIILSHLSQTNNTPKLALQTFNSLIKERLDIFPEVHISSRENPTELFKIN